MCDRCLNVRACVLRIIVILARLMLPLFDLSYFDNPIKLNLLFNRVEYVYKPCFRLILNPYMHHVLFVLTLPLIKVFNF